MNRKTAIEHIEKLFPADSEYKDIASVGKELLEQAKREATVWRTEPTEVLIRYAHLCIQKEQSGCQSIHRKG